MTFKFEIPISQASRKWHPQAIKVQPKTVVCERLLKNNFTLAKAALSEWSYSDVILAGKEFYCVDFALLMAASDIPALTFIMQRRRMNDIMSDRLSSSQNRTLARLALKLDNPSLYPEPLYRSLPVISILEEQPAPLHSLSKVEGLGKLQARMYSSNEIWPLQFK